MKIQYQMKSPIGPLYLTASEKGLEGVYWHPQQVDSVKTLSPSSPQKKELLAAVRQLEEYFAGKRKQFDLRLNFSGTPFQEQVWKQLYRIPYGTTVSYKDIARRIDNPKAVRAVGTANGRNPICVIIPCHRVINAGGGMGGYSSGVHIKQRLLQLESPLDKSG